MDDRRRAMRKALSSSCLESSLNHTASMPAVASARHRDYCQGIETAAHRDKKLKAY